MKRESSQFQSTWILQLRFFCFFPTGIFSAEWNAVFLKTKNPKVNLSLVGCWVISYTDFPCLREFLRLMLPGVSICIIQSSSVPPSFKPSMRDATQTPQRASDPLWQDDLYVVLRGNMGYEKLNGETSLLFPTGDNYP